VTLDGEEAVLEGVDAFLREALPGTWVRAIDEDDADALAEARPQLDLDGWWRRVADTGYLTPTWPRRHGGLDASPKTAARIAAVLRRYKVPRTTNPIGLGQVATALLDWGTDEQRDRFLRPIARHEEIWCQLFSEPGAGSDLAGLSTRAERDGDVWVVRGQKVWSSMAHLASYGLLLARTDADVPKHRGLSVFLLPMDQAGVTVRPLRHLTGDAEFNEVFLDGAIVDDVLRVGALNDGWRIANAVLMGERTMLSGGGGTSTSTLGGRTVLGLIRHHAPVTDTALRERLVRCYIEERLLHLTNERAAARQRAGEKAGPERSITKLFHSEHIQRLQELAVDLEGAGGQAWVDGDRWRKNNVWSYLWSRSRTIAGGTSEIQRNILGERVLGLPRDVQVDRDVPWSQVRRS
jgi:alkylation response protein AidB-like acyl-CoA dehydrogenase